MKEPHNWVLQVREFGGPEYTDVLIRRHLYPQTMRRRLPFVMVSRYDFSGLELDRLDEETGLWERI